ncbi:bacillithiol biosynthesis cysteine-adding enzyme BshC [bacterium]|nr:bacillithiol biosynthesis cysteine-adding enzyme BshC [bacterium]
MILDSKELHEIPRFPALVADCIEKRTQFDFGFPLEITTEFWQKRSKEEAEFNHPRSALTESLKKQLSGLELSEKVAANIEALKHPETLTIVTGQQVGLGGGPLLTLYKALSTIALSHKIENKSGVRTVPMFWMATSDHNLFETAQLSWINLENELVHFSYDGHENRAPVGSMLLGERAIEFLRRLEKELPDSDFKPDLMERLKNAYRPEHTFAHAFRILGNDLLGKFGMIMFDPEELSLKKSYIPFWSKAVEEVDDRLERLRTRSLQLQDSGYAVQAPIERGRPALFYHEDGVRRKVVLEGRAQRAQSDMILSRDELKVRVEEEPENFSAGVTLRPLLQSYLLPVGAYVAGPHEMAYWTQLSDAFEPLGLYKPAVVHRMNLTLVEGKVKKRLNKLEVTAREFLDDSTEIVNRLVKNHGDDQFTEVFQEAKSLSGTCYTKLKDIAEGPYAGLEKEMDTAFNKIRYHLEKLENRFNKRLKQQHSDLIKSLDRLRTHLHPAEKLQERVLSPHYYLARYGFSLLDKLVDFAETAEQKHYFIDLEEMLK